MEGSPHRYTQGLESTGMSRGGGGGGGGVSVMLCMFKYSVDVPSSQSCFLTLQQVQVMFQY